MLITQLGRMIACTSVCTFGEKLVNSCRPWTVMSNQTRPTRANFWKKLGGRLEASCYSGFMHTGNLGKPTTTQGYMPGGVTRTAPDRLGNWTGQRTGRRYVDIESGCTTKQHGRVLCKGRFVSVIEEDGLGTWKGCWLLLVCETAPTDCTWHCLGLVLVQYISL